MIARLPGSESGWVKRTARAPVPGAELVRESEVFGVPRPLVPVLVRVQVLAAFVSLVPEVLLPTPTPARW